MSLSARYKIQVENVNLSGSDWVVADLHGGYPAFKALLAKVQSKGNRAFCCGDLVDRGKYSLDILRAIHQHNQCDDKGKIHAVLGNHEIMCRAAIEKLKYVASIYRGDASALRGDYDKIVKNNAEYHLYNYLVANSGKWLFNLFIDDLNQQKIVFDIATEEIVLRDNSDIKIVADFLDSLPFIIYVKGDFKEKRMPFIIVHADMPYDDYRFLNMVQRGELDIESDNASVDHATTARDNFNDKRSASSMLVLAGHNIVGDDFPAVDSKINKLYLDFCAWANDLAICVNMSDLTCEWIGDMTVSQHHNPEFDNQFIEVQAYLVSLKSRSELLHKVHSCHDYADFLALADQEKIESLMLTDLALRHDALRLEKCCSGWTEAHSRALEHDFDDNNQELKALVPLSILNNLICGVLRVNEFFLKEAALLLDELYSKMQKSAEDDKFLMVTPAEIKSVIAVIEYVDWQVSMYMELEKQLNLRDKDELKKLLFTGTGGDKLAPIFIGWSLLHAIALMGSIKEFEDVKSNLTNQSSNSIASMPEILFIHIMKFCFSDCPQLDDALQRFCAAHQSKVDGGINFTPDDIIQLRLQLLPPISQSGFLCTSANDSQNSNHETLNNELASNSQSGAEYKNKLSQ